MIEMREIEMRELIEGEKAHDAAALSTVISVTAVTEDSGRFLHGPVRMMQPRPVLISRPFGRWGIDRACCADPMEQQHRRKPAISGGLKAREETP